jgi:hypothetical protein
MKSERERERTGERAETLNINHKTEQQTYTNAENRKIGLTYTINSKCRVSGNMAGWPWVGMEG